MFKTIFFAMLIVLGIYEVRAGITLPLNKIVVDEKNKPTGETLPATEDEIKLLKFQKIYFIFMGIFTSILGIISIIKQNFLPTYILFILALLPLLLNKSIGVLITKKNPKQ